MLWNNIQDFVELFLGAATLIKPIFNNSDFLVLKMFVFTHLSLHSLTCRDKKFYGLREGLLNVWEVCKALFTPLSAIIADYTWDVKYFKVAHIDKMCII